MDAYQIWAPSQPPRAIVQILHGMAEHIDRYGRMAKALNKAGFLVCGRDHRGHGPKAELLGYFADENGWDVILNDAHEVSLDIKKQYPSVPFSCWATLWAAFWPGNTHCGTARNWTG